MREEYNSFLSTPTVLRSINRLIWPIPIHRWNPNIGLSLEKSRRKYFLFKMNNVTRTFLLLWKTDWDQTAMCRDRLHAPHRATGGSRSSGKLLNNVIWHLRFYRLLVYVLISHSFCFVSFEDERSRSLGRRLELLWFYHTQSRVVSQAAGFPGRARFRARFGFKFVKIFWASFGPACKVFWQRWTLLSPVTAEAIELIKSSAKNI